MKRDRNEDEVPQFDVPTENEIVVESPHLLDELLLIIFHQLKRGDLGACKKVSKHWERMASDPSLNWVLAVAFPIKQFELSDLQEVKKIKELHASNKLSFHFVTSTPDQQQPHFGFFGHGGASKIEIRSDKGDVLGSLQPHIDHYSRPAEFTNQLQWSELYFKLILEDQKILTQPRWKVNFTPMFNEDGDQILSWNTEIEMHSLRFEKVALQAASKGQRDHTRLNKQEILGDDSFSTVEWDLIFLSVKLNTNRFLNRVMKSATTNPFIPEANYERLKQPAQITATLFEYQMDAVSWMQYIENNVNSDIKYGKLSSWGAVQTDVLFDLETSNLYLPSSIDKFTGVLQIKGGVIADEMGLGKTLEMIALTLSNKPDEDYMKKVGKKEGKLYYSRASLVHCPSHLAKQWKDEVQKNTKATVAVITTINEFKNYSIDDLCSKFDIVCVSFPLLMQNKNYQADDAKSRQKLHLYHWYRIILDEGHEIIDGVDKSSGYRQKLIEVPINNFSSKFRWFCSGTPFPSEEVICGCMHYLIPDEPGSFFFKDLFLNTENGEFQRNRYHHGRGGKKTENWAIFDIILNNFYWRNTKESVGKDEYNLPPYVEDIIIHPFTEIEKCLYDDCLDSSVEKLQICSNSIQNDTDLESMRASYTARRNQELISYTQQVNNYSSYIDEYNKGNRDFNAMYNQFHIWGNHDLISLKRQLQEYTRHKMQAEKRVKIWSTCNPVPRATPIPKEAKAKSEKKAKAAPLDVQDMTLDEMRQELTKRGKSANGARGVLTKRLQSLVDKELEMAGESDSEDSFHYSQPKYDAENMVLKYGTKLAKIMEYLNNMWKTNPDSKVIIFSKFSHQLERIGRLLDGEGIRSVVVAGNVARRNKAIVEFKSKCKVILLGLGSAASGTNLTEATHVFLVDPMSGTAKEIKAIESQAIARAHRRGQEKEITIVRFLMKDTIELSNYLETYGSSKLSAEEKKEEKPSKPKPLFLKSKSASTLLANTPSLQRAGSIANMVGEEFI